MTDTRCNWNRYITIIWTNKSESRHAFLQSTQYHMVLRLKACVPAVNTASYSAQTESSCSCSQRSITWCSDWKLVFLQSTQHHIVLRLKAHVPAVNAASHGAQTESLCSCSQRSITWCSDWKLMKKEVAHHGTFYHQCKKHLQPITYYQTEIDKKCLVSVFSCVVSCNDSRLVGDLFFQFIFLGTLFVAGLAQRWLLAAHTDPGHLV